VKRTLLIAGLAVVLVAGFLVSASIGQLPVSPANVVGAIADHLGIHTSLSPERMIDSETIWQIRLPRVFMAALVGASLGVAGAVMQVIFGNPLAEPGVVGVSAGAALGAAFAITLGIEISGGWGTALLAFVGAVCATAIAYITARQRGRVETVTLLLTGIAVNAVAGAGLALLLFAGTQSSREEVIFWQLGSINGTRWYEVGAVAIIVLATTVLVFTQARRYDLLALGERTAQHLGVRVERLRIMSIIAVALLVGVGVAFVGITAFVGLVVPHIIRMIVGPAHRDLLWLSALGGAVLLTTADVLARTVRDGADIPIGVLTALIGGPFFFWLVRSTRAKAGGWG
jgi:iron complex transport system permease protein